MSENDTAEPIDWALTTWEGARREQQRRWAKLSLREMILALEEMQTLAERLAPSSGAKSLASAARTEKS